MNNTMYWKKSRTIINGILLMLFALLSGCAQISHKDGPPDFYVDETKVPDAVPQQEALSKYGNYHRYVVWGKVYHTLPTAKNYEERGIASWYGTKFHKHHTSSGERYDMLAMTAAHKTLPLPTYVQVTNLKNGRKVIVKVNDRGPFESNRLIDLSYVAAKKLGMLGHGTTYVDVKAIDPNQYAMHMANPSVPMFADAHHFHRSHHQKYPMYLQVGTFVSLNYAESVQHRLSKVIAPPVKVALQTHKHSHFYRVQIGPIKNMETANRINATLKSAGFEGKVS